MLSAASRPDRAGGDHLPLQETSDTREERKLALAVVLLQKPSDSPPTEPRHRDTVLLSEPLKLLIFGSLEVYCEALFNRHRILPHNAASCGRRYIRGRIVST